MYKWRKISELKPWPPLEDNDGREHNLDKMALAYVGGEDEEKDTLAEVANREPYTSMGSGPTPLELAIRLDQWYRAEYGKCLSWPECGSTNFAFVKKVIHKDHLGVNVKLVNLLLKHGARVTE